MKVFAPLTGVRCVLLQPVQGCRSSPADISGLLPQVAVETVLAVLAAEARMLPARMESLDEFPTGAIDVELTE
jgi:hypothetical protein